MEGDDPYNWTVDQVCKFFRDDVQEILHRIPNSPRLPTWPPFLEALKENDVTGFVLLTSVGKDEFRDDFGIRSLGQRSTLLYCINKLRERSSAYHRQHEDKESPRVAIATTTLSQSNLEVAPASETVVSTPDRPGEVRVHDRHGRKRRKLNLATVAVTNPTCLPPESGIGYFGNASMSVDQLFFCRTQLGREIEHIESAELTVLDTDRTNDTAEYNFQFYDLERPAGEALYVYRQYRHFIHQDPIELVRRGHRALAIMPYREELSQLANKVQSAIVVQCASDSNTPVAIRENEVYLANGGDYHGIPQDPTLGQYDYLAQKYSGGGQGDSDSDSDSMTSSAFDRMNAEIEAEWKSEQAEVAASQAKRLSTEDIPNIVDETVESFIHQWTVAKRPSKEQNQAWSVWKLLKGSKSMRLVLIEDAKSKIHSFDRRLLGQKSYVIKAECSTKDEVVRLCEALKATVVDREEQKWKIDVWERKLEPAHVVRHGQHVGVRATTSASQSAISFAPRPEDRLSIEPGPIPAVEEQGDIFMTPQSSTAPHKGEAEDESFDGSDEASESDDFVEDDIHSHSDHPHDDSADNSNNQNDKQASAVKPPPVHVDEEQGLGSSSEKSSGEDLPGLKMFFTQESNNKNKKTPKETPKKTSNHNFAKPSEPASASRPKASTVIEISSDSASTPNTGSTRSGRGRTKIDWSQDVASNSKPENSSVRDVDSWKIEDLVREQDRKRMVIKLLHLEGAPMIFAIKALWIEKAMVGFKQDILQLLKLLIDEPARSGTPPVALLQSARLAIVWHCLRPEVMRGDYPEGIAWGAVERDTAFFMSFFSILMQKSDGKLFSEQSPSPSPLLKKHSKSDPIEIDSDSDDTVETPKSRRKRKRSVKYSQKAFESQHTALERQQRYRAAETQSPNSQQLLATVGSGNVLLPIDLLKQAEGVHFINPAVASVMKDHQINGVRFMWRELTAGADADDDGQGCVLAHAMGLGKTMQTITLLVAVAEAAHSKDPKVSSQLPRNLRPGDVAHKERSLRVLVLCPPALLENWRREIQHWTNGILGEISTVDALNKARQMDILQNWHTFGGVLLMGYSLFSKRVNRKRAEEKAGKANEDGARLDEYLLEGPEILVADEAHHVKNIGAGVSIAVNQVQTSSRIALTGTPMSNDVGEMYALISFAAPGFLGGHTEFKAKFGEPIEQGTYADSSPYEQRRSKVKLATLSRLIEPKIHRADITALKGTLQPKVEFVVTLPLTDLQRSVYNKYLDALLGGGKNDKASQVTIFSWLSLLGLLTNHPLAFKRKLNETKKSRKSKSGKSNKLDGGSASPILLDDDSAEGVDYEEEAVKTLNFSEETVKQVTAGIDDSTDPNLSAKMDILMDILALSKRCEDKVLVFSSSIPTLNYVGDLLRARSARFGRICGGVPAPKRPQIIADLTDGLTDILLISTKAGGVGLNIQAANRVVILDFGFNPAHEEQAIGRAYRFGQPKPVFVYRLIAGGTFEDNIYNKQLFKTSLTQRVVDKKNPRRNAARSTRHYLYEPKEVHQQDLAEWVGKDPDVFDQLLQRQLSSPKDTIRKLTTIETLQREGDDPPLDAEELRQAEEEYQTSIAAAMGPRGQVANVENIPAFVAAQTRQISQPGVSSMQHTPHSRLMERSHGPSQGPSSTAPARDPRPSPRIRLASTAPQP